MMFGLPVLIVGALIAVLAMWAFGANPGFGSSSTANLTWNVEYWHRNAEGLVLLHKTDHNVVSEIGKQAAMARLIDVDVTTSGAADTFDQVVLMNASHTVDTSTAVTDTKILTDVAGAAGSTAVADGPTVHLNPVSGTFTDSGSIDGAGKVTVIFKGATGNPDAAVQMLLVKTVEDDSAADAGAGDGTAAGGADADTNLADIAAADILAAITISVDLAATDTLQIDWTIDID